MFVKVNCILLLKLKKQNILSFTNSTQNYTLIFCAPYRNKMTSS